MGFSKLPTYSLICLLASGLFASTNFADEIIISGQSGSKITIGDFDCSKCPSPSRTTLNLWSGHDSTNLTAGELWQFFDSQGIHSLDRLKLCLDVESNAGLLNSGINSMELKIEDPSNLGSMLTNVSLKGDSLSIPGYDIAPFKPEAILEVALDYDFMKRFSADSTEKISLNVIGDANSMPVISVQGDRGEGFFSSMINVWALGAFAIFWALVFVALNRFTKPQVNLPQSKNISAPKHQALSA